MKSYLKVFAVYCCYTLVALLVPGCTGCKGGSSVTTATPPASTGGPATISYVNPVSYFTKGLAASSITPVVTGSPTSITISPALPAGLILNSTTGVISGTPTTAVPPTTYTVTAHATDGSTATSTVTFEIAIPFTVNTTTDAVDATPGDQICATAGAQCSLRAALQEAAALTGILSIVTVNAGTYIATSTLNINSRLILIGDPGGVTIDGNNTLNKIISIGNYPVRLESITVQNGNDAVGITVDGVGIESISDNLYLKACTIINNFVTTNNANIAINGIGLKATSASMTGSITLESSYFGANQLTLGGSVTSGSGKGMAAYLSANTVTITDGTFAGNNSSGGGAGTYATFGGGIYAVSNNFSISNTGFNANTETTAGSNDRGGAIYYDGTGTTALFSIIQCTANQAKGGGGCIWNNATTPSTITDSTFTGNIDTTGNGGGVTYRAVSNSTILNSYFSSGGGTVPLQINTLAGGTFNIKNSTFNSSNSSPSVKITSISAANVTFENCTLRSTSTGGSFNRAASASMNVYFKNTILETTNGTAACSGSLGNTFSQGYNLARDASCTFLGGGGDIVSTNPLLSAPSANGGNSQTCAIAAGSPARDAIPLGSCSLTTDQRGNVRPNGGACDIGAYEY